MFGDPSSLVGFVKIAQKLSGISNINIIPLRDHTAPEAAGIPSAYEGGLCSWNNGDVRIEPLRPKVSEILTMPDFMSTC